MTPLVFLCLDWCLSWLDNIRQCWCCDISILYPCKRSLRLMILHCCLCVDCCFYRRYPFPRDLVVMCWLFCRFAQTQYKFVGGKLKWRPNWPSQAAPYLLDFALTYSAKNVRRYLLLPIVFNLLFTLVDKIANHDGAIVTNSVYLQDQVLICTT